MFDLLVAFLFAVAAGLVVVRGASVHARKYAWRYVGRPQSTHGHPAPRLGGIAVFLALLLLGVIDPHFGANSGSSTLVELLTCSLPAFVVGSYHDLHDTVAPRGRLLATALSAALAYFFLGAAIRETDIPWLDPVVATPVGAFVITVFAVAGISNAMNVIDGLNGLASMCALMMLLALAYGGYQARDEAVTTLALAGAGAVLGFFVWNFPGGLLFLGDGGAYFLGFYVAEVALLLLVRNPEVSPLFPLLICIYPVFETVFSIYRRFIRKGQSPAKADGIHLHSLLFRRMMRWAVGSHTARQMTRGNSLTSPLLWLLCLLSVLPAMAFWNDSRAQALFIVLFGVTYVILYWRIVRFRTPNWFRRGKRGLLLRFHSRENLQNSGGLHPDGKRGAAARSEDRESGGDRSK